MDELLKFLADCYEDLEVFTRDLVATNALPPSAYAIGVTLAFQLRAQLEVGRTIATRCAPAPADDVAVVDLKREVLQCLASAHRAHPAYNCRWDC